MRSIERLPEAIHSSVRSGVVICDLTRIVEELVFNSLDAGATKVSVAVGVGSYYVKVVDNGYGITRDGLVHLGERYATSKVDHLAPMDTGTENLDFHGEALCSISDVSLLEIVTKARGKPNGYRKIMKNSKCLFLGINDDRQHVGTTVTVRDIFYNQPVRRKHMESSPKKVLDSIKMSVLRIALVHVNVSFKVVDVESADELLHTGPSSSPLPILSSNFGIENSATFHKLNLSDDELKLSGYISDPHGIFSPKAIQYVCIHGYDDINSRFIYKGPIHKLLNQLAAKFDLLSSCQPATSFPSEKRNKYDMCPTFILNLHCPRSYYDIITSERTSVEFKDWAPVLTFIENGVMHLWTENISHEKDTPNTFGSVKKRCRKQNCQTLLDLHSPQQKKLCENYDNMPALENCVSSNGKLSRKVSELNEPQIKAGLPSETDYLNRSCDGSLAAYRVTTKKDIRNHLSPCSVFSLPHVAYIYGKREDGISSALGNILPAFDGKIDNTSIVSGFSSDCLKFSDDIQIDQEPSRKYLRSCSFERSLLHERNSPARDERFELGSDDIRIKKRWIDCDDSMVDEIDLAICGRDIQCHEAPLFQSSPVTRYDMHEILEFPIRDSVKSSSVFRNILPDSSKQVLKRTSSWQSCRSGWSPLTAEKIIGIKFLDDDDEAIYADLIEGCSEFGKNTRHGYPAEGKDDDLKLSNLNTNDSWQQQKCSFMNFSPDNKREIGEFHWGNFENNLSPKPFKRFRETDWSPLPSYGEKSPKNYSVPSFYDTSPVEHECGRPNSRNQETMLNRKKSSIRSHSAPPVYKGKKRYMGLAESSTMLSAKGNFQNICGTHAPMGPSDSIHGKLHAETRNSKCSQKSVGQYPPSPIERSVMDCSIAKRPGLEMTPEISAIQNGGPQKRGQLINMESAECLDLKEIQDSFDSGWKWRNCCFPTAGGRGSDNQPNQDIILDISSDILHLAGDSLVPKSIDRTSLEDAKVLNQVDKKFIAVVAGKTLAIIDQHAADERIRLEELRHKVLSGEMKTITYLDAERELVLPEIGYQLLHNYAAQIQTWGWICNIHSQDTSSFSKHLDFLHRQPTVVKLLAVPCILGVNLTDIDLLEFLQQLADTDGSSTIPPSVHCVLNNKACRGAIMFGDTLLPSECSLIVEELKRTSLCFQCAHGRPTTVPLVNLDLLHNKIAKLGSHESWHGLRQHKLSLERSSQHLSSALY
ncbi:hypothetical protein Pfo_018960 [Paulownia fortunei]|nr:hypothetical protein Pfo_018960 [Paulownia fortunei]